MPQTTFPWTDHTLIVNWKVIGGGKVILASPKSRLNTIRWNMVKIGGVYPKEHIGCSSIAWSVNEGWGTKQDKEREWWRARLTLPIKALPFLIDLRLAPWYTLLFSTTFLLSVTPYSLSLLTIYAGYALLIHLVVSYYLASVFGPYIQYKCIFLHFLLYLHTVACHICCRTSEHIPSM